MEEEFLESDIIFEEYPPRINEEIRFSSSFWNSNTKSKRRKLIIKDGGGSCGGGPNSTVPAKIEGKLSFPVTIPAAPNKWAATFVDDDEEDGDGDGDGDELVPPHLIIGRRVITARKMAFSVCTGNGRTLKGRDLSQVRNTILRMTGFLET